MRVILPNGKELSVDTSSLTEEDTWRNTSLAVVDDDLKLWNAWLVNVQRMHRGINKWDEEISDFVCERIFLHEPTDNELINFMVNKNVGRFDYVTITPIKVLAYESEYRKGRVERLDGVQNEDL